MGAILDSTKNIRQNSKDTSGQAYKIKEKLEKDKDKGIKMEPNQRVPSGIPAVKKSHSIEQRLVISGIQTNAIGTVDLERKTVTFLVNLPEGITATDKVKEHVQRALGTTRAEFEIKIMYVPYDEPKPDVMYQ